MTLAELLERLRAGDQRAVARLISWVEDGDRDQLREAAEALNPARREGGLKLGKGNRGGDADDDRVLGKRATDFACQIGDSHRLHAENHDAGTLRRLLVVVRFFLSGNGGNAVVALRQLGGPLGAPDCCHDLHGVCARLQEAAHDGLVH